MNCYKSSQIKDIFVCNALNRYQYDYLANINIKILLLIFELKMGGFELRV